MIVINSAAYVVPEFRAEFGQIPPCLLPIGNRKLLQYQVERLKAAYKEPIVVSLPDEYELTIDEHKLLIELGIKAVFVPVAFTLAEALLYVLNTTGELGEPLRLLHGDTLIEDLPVGEDLLAVATTEDDYIWEKEKIGSDREVVWCGYFAFSSTRDFIRCLALARGDFVKSVRLYAAERPILNTEVQSWHDLGHINTYFLSRSHITTQRSFNSLQIKNGQVWKSGIPAIKICAESEWFKSLPPILKRYAPQLIDSGVDKRTGEPFYQLEYLPCSPLNELFVHGRNPGFFWNKIFSLMKGFLHDARDCLQSSPSIIESINSDTNDLYIRKTHVRLEEYAASNGIDLEVPTRYSGHVLPSLREIAEDCISRTLELACIPAVLHGDFCFSNILFDSRGGAIKVIDPRGLNQRKQFTLHGDQKYDLAKACHSIIGLYDFIIAGRYQIENNSEESPSINFNLDSRIISIQDKFLESEIIPGVTTMQIMPLTVMLFISMLPLHSDRPERQEAMLLNALRLYLTYIMKIPNQPLNKNFT
ncbi:hypothetical protein ACQKEM_07110 [Pseudomonas sp. NPDC077382]